MPCLQKCLATLFGNFEVDTEMVDGEFTILWPKKSQYNKEIFNSWPKDLLCFLNENLICSNIFAWGIAFQFKLI